MADVQCGKFELIGWDPKTGILTFRARLTPAPSAQWMAVFHEYQTTERMLGNPAVARINNDVIEFQVPEPLAEVAAKVIRRCLEKTNQDAPKRQGRLQKDIETHQKRVEEEWKRVQNKFREGL
jgi:hypothetical protein